MDHKRNGRTHREDDAGAISFDKLLDKFVKSGSGPLPTPEPAPVYRRTPMPEIPPDEEE